MRPFSRVGGGDSTFSLPSPPPYPLRGSHGAVSQRQRAAAPSTIIPGGPPAPVTRPLAARAHARQAGVGSGDPPTSEDDWGSECEDEGDEAAEAAGMGLWGHL